MLRTIRVTARQAARRCRSLVPSPLLRSPPAAGALLARRRAILDEQLVVLEESGEFESLFPREALRATVRNELMELYEQFDGEVLSLDDI